MEVALSLDASVTLGVVHRTVGGIHVDTAFQYTDDYQENTYSFVNLVRTTVGGSHEDGYRTAFTKAVNDYIYNVGTSGEVHGRFILDVVFRQIRRRYEKASD